MGMNLTHSLLRFPAFICMNSVPLIFSQLGLLLFGEQSESIELLVYRHGDCYYDYYLIIFMKLTIRNKKTFGDIFLIIQRTC